ncbi:MAG: autotransporter-associated beta strand repeat-containing protein [Thermoguttaceae bacterium]|nr:autotransporter-associated beta strand repeat-containing protein [Thermoguttaceae bacterium]
MRSSKFDFVSSSRRFSKAALTVRAMLGMGSLVLCGAVSQGADINVTADSSDPITLDRYTSIGVADAGPFTLSGPISGGYAVAKQGAGTLDLTGDNTFTGGLQIQEGTVTVYANAGNETSANYTPLGTGTVTIMEGTKLVWGINTSNTNINAPALTNTITGAGTLRLERRSNHGNTNYALNSKLNNFTGTLELGNNTRLSWDQPNNEQFHKISTIRIEAGSEFWTVWGENTGEVKSAMVLNGYGNGAGGDGAQRGALRIEGNTTFSGTVTLESDSLIGLANAYELNFTNDLELNGKTLYFSNVVHQGGEFIISGNISAGTINNRGQMFATENSGSSSHRLKFTALDSDQTIAANIQQNNTTTAMVFAPEDGRTTTVTGVISGSGAVVKDGAGTLVFAGLNTFSGGLTINEGTVRMQDDGTYKDTSINTKKYALGNGAITINENGTLIWHNQYNNDTTLSNPISGSGKLILDADHNRSNNKNDTISDLSGFTGTIELTRHARLCGNTLGGTTSVIVNDGTTFWGSGGTFNANFTIYGNGNLAGGDNPRGVLIGSGVNTFSGTITAMKDSMIGIRDGGTVNLNGTIETNGHQVKFDQTHMKGGGFNLYGNVASTGDSLGTLYFENRGESNQYAVNFGTASASTDAVTQTIAANIDYRNSSGALTFQPGENRTILVTGNLAGTQGFRKTGAGTLTIAENAPASGAVEVTGGKMTVGKAENAGNTELAPNTAGFTSLTVTNGAVVDLNTANTSLSTLNVASGTVSINQKYRRINNTEYAGAHRTAAVTIGSESGDAAVLKLAEKGLGDHSGTMTIYDGGELIIAGRDCSIGWSNGITFIGGGKISSGSSDAYFNFRGDGNQVLRVQGADAHASISSMLYLYDAGFGSIDVQEADSSLTLSGGVYNGMSHDIGFRKTGEGTLYIENENKYRQLQINEGTVHFRGNGKLIPQNNGNTFYGVNVSIADGAKLVLDNAANFTSEHTPAAEYPAAFSIADGGTLIVNHDGWQMTDVIEAALTQGTLGGSGRIVGNIDTAGLTISPGDGTIAQLTVDGKLKLTDGLIDLELGANSTADTLKITGDADFTGTEIFVSSTDGSTVELGDEFLLISAPNLTDDILQNVSFSSEIQFAYDGGLLSTYVENGSLYAVALDSATVPEPSTWLLLTLGGLAIFGLRRKVRS